MPDTDQIQATIGVFGHHLAKERGQILHHGRTHIAPTGIGEQHAKVVLLQRQGNRSRQRIAADDEKSPGVRFCHAQQHRHRARGETLQGHRANNDNKGHGHQHGGLFKALLFQLQGKQGGHRRGDDTARCNPAEHGTLPPRQ